MESSDGCCSLGKYIPANVRAAAMNTYFPWSGAVCYSVLSASVIHPNLLPRIFPEQDVGTVENVLLVASHMGIGAFMAGRPHLMSLPCKQRWLYATYLTVLFNMGSLLSWAVIRVALPSNGFIRVLLGFLIGGSTLAVGHKYLKHVDKKA